MFCVLVMRAVWMRGRIHTVASNVRCVELPMVLKGYTSRDVSYGLLNWPLGACRFP